MLKKSKNVLLFMSEECFGDVIVCRGNEWDNRAIELFTKSQYTHSALRTGENSAVSLRLEYKDMFKRAVEVLTSDTGISKVPFFDKFLKYTGVSKGPNLERIIQRIDLENPPETYSEYIILKHKNITPEKRIEMKKTYEKTKIENYDLKLFLKMAYRHSKEMKVNFKNASTVGAYFFGKALSYFYDDSEIENKPDPLLVPSLYLCSNIISALYNHVNLEIIPGLNWNQIEPQHFMLSANFTREKKWTKMPEKKGEKRFFIFHGLINNKP
jgi:hypothetical protein